MRKTGKITGIIAGIFIVACVVMCSIPPTPPSTTPPTPDTTEIVLGAPLPDIDGVKILDARPLWEKRISSGYNLRIIGEVISTRSVPQDSHIYCGMDCTLYDANDRIRDTEHTIAHLEINEKRPFTLKFYGLDKSEVASYEITFAYIEVIPGHEK